jgi:hypothetical protein
MSDDARKSTSVLNLSGDAPRDLATALIARAEEDLIYEPRVVGESPFMLQHYFQDFIMAQLEEHSVSFDDHPLLRLFMETHARELTEFVMTGVGLGHHIRLSELEKLGPDPERLRRIDLWDSFVTHIKKAEEHFVSGLGGLQKILAHVEEIQGLRRDTPDLK